MIAYLKGKLTFVKGDLVIVEVAGIGYRLLIPTSAVSRLPQVGEEVFIHTYLHVREDAMLLYGFLSEEERELFEILQNVSGIGPKAALAILSTTTVANFKQAVLQDKVALLTKIPGIGKKTAQRVILELKDKLAKENINIDNSLEVTVDVAQGVTGDALNALMSLGYSSAEANRAVNQVVTANGSTDVEEIIKMALKILAR